MSTRLDRLLPPPGVARTLSMQSVLFATGRGSFETGSAVFFTQIVGLSAGQVGLGLTVAGAVAFALAVPTGRLVDRVGSRLMWTVGSGAGAALFLVWPFIHGLPGYLAMMIALELAGNAAGSSWGAYTLEVFTREERVRNQAFMRAALNAGFTLGALVAGIALAFDSDAVIRAVPVVTAVALAANAVWIQWLPAVGTAGTGEAAAPSATVPRGSVLRNRGFVALFACDGVLSTNQVLLTVLIPLWLVQETDAPRVLLAWLFGTNTVLAVALQVRATRGVDDVPSSLRAAWRSAAFFVLSCVIVAVTHDTVGWVTIALV